MESLIILSKLSSQKNVRKSTMKNVSPFYNQTPTKYLIPSNDQINLSENKPSTPQDHITEAINSFKKYQNCNDENTLFVDFLFHLEPFNQIISESAGDEAQEIIRNLSYNLRYEHANKNTILFRFGDYSEKFYLILKGQVSVAVPNEEEMELTEEEYFLYLLKLRQYNEKDILNKVISKNYTSYFFEEKTFDLWIHTAYNTLIMLRSPQRGMNNFNIHNKNQRRQSMLKSPMKRRKISSVGDSSPMKRVRRFSVHQQPQVQTNSDYKTVFDTAEKRNLVIRLENEIIAAMKTVNPSIMEYLPEFNLPGTKKNKNEVTVEEYITRTKPLLFSYNYGVHRKRVYVTTYFIANEMSSGDKFGEMMTDIHNNNILNTRVMTIITKEDCDFGTLDKISYNKCLKEVSEKMRKSKLNFLLQMEIFKNCNKNLFMKNFCNFFTKKILHSQDTLFEEGADSESGRIIYMIRDGEISTFCRKSIDDVHYLMNILGYSSLLQTEDSEDDFVNDDDFKKYCSKKNIIRLQILKENDILGLNDCVVNGRFAYSAVCSSSQATVYEIHINFFKMLTALDSAIERNVNEYVLIKRNLLVKILLKNKKSKKDFYAYREGNEPRFGCIKFHKDKPNDLKELIMKKNNPKLISINQIASRNKKKLRKVVDTEFKLKSHTTNTYEKAILNTDSTLITKTKKKINFPKLNLVNITTIPTMNKKTTERSSNSLRNSSTLFISDRKLLLPQKKPTTLDYTKTRRLLMEALPGFFDGNKEKAHIIFNMTNKYLYKNVPKKYD